MVARHVVSVGVVACALGAVRGQYSESFDADNGLWQTWVQPGSEPPIRHEASGGVGDSGHIAVDLAQIGFQGPLASPLDYIYWSAYLYADDVGVGRFDFRDASVRVQLRGESVDLQSGGLRFYISRYEQDSGLHAIYATADLLSIGDGVWTLNELRLDRLSWVRMVDAGLSLDQVLDEVTEFGFVVTNVAETDADPSGVLHIDSFSTDAPLVPAPAGSALLVGVGLVLAGRRGR